MSSLKPRVPLKARTLVELAAELAVIDVWMK